ncbi:MAG: triose-phosphate isomerase [Acidimicrobiales bacterium]|nr:triose-phosphate isomerase [Acidimicrobiales bacterium]
MSTRRPLISGNWKMNLNHFEAMKLIQELSYQITGDDIELVDVSVHPPFTDIRTVQTVLDSDKIPFFLGAQHCHFEERGAFTGEVAPSMLAKLNVKYVIVGHSERREIFNETDEMVNAKVKAILGAEMTPIVCCGETLEERDAGDAETKVGAQVQAALTGLTAEQVGGLVIAYEPIWAIGTGRTASAEDAQAMCHHVRAGVRGIYGDEAADSVRVQYGGSVKPANANELLTQADIDGALVGGASLSADDFSRIVQYRLL